MSQRFRPTDAFVDESIRGQRYLMGCVLVEARRLGPIRRATSALVAEGKRIHFHQELDSTRRDTLQLFTAMRVKFVVVVCHRRHGVTEFAARELCLEALVRYLQEGSVSRLTIESRQDDRDDRRTILRARAADPSLVFQHVAGLDEPLLWIADALTWAVGSGGRWLTAVEPVMAELIQIRP